MSDFRNNCRDYGIAFGIAVLGILAIAIFVVVTQLIFGCNTVAN